MKTPDHDRAMQRVKVGATGLAIVALLIWLTSAIFGSVRERPASVTGATRADVVANLASTNISDPAAEPLSDIGVAPSTQSNETAPGTGARR